MLFPVLETSINKEYNTLITLRTAVMIMAYLVYKHTTPSGKTYIGITNRTAEERWKNGKGYLNNKHFMSAIEKYGWDNITHEIIACDLSAQDAWNMEQNLIAKYKSNIREYGYNHSVGGEHGFLGGHQSEQTKKKISEAGKGRKPSEKSYQRIIEWGKSRRKPICIYNINGEFLATTDSIVAAEELTGVHNSLITACCKGKYSQSSDFIFKYADDQRVISPYKGKRKSVCMFTIFGKYVATFKSAIEAGEKMGVAHGHINDCCLFKNATCANYIWLYEHEKDRINEKLLQVSNTPKISYPVVALDEKTEEVVFYFDTIKAATEAGFLGDHISCIVRGIRYKKTGGYKWRYATEEEYEKYSTVQQIADDRD